MAGQIQEDMGNTDYLNPLQVAFRLGLGVKITLVTQVNNLYLTEPTGDHILPDLTAHFSIIGHNIFEFGMVGN